MKKIELISDFHHLFSGVNFNEIFAHGGTRPILSCRIVSTTKTVNFIDMTIVPPGSDIGMHTHADDNEEIYIVVSGIATMIVDDRHITVTAGDVIVNRPGGTHGLWNTGAEEVRLVVIEIPSGAPGRPGT